jgi:hypothetical protein
MGAALGCQSLLAASGEGAPSRLPLADVLWTVFPALIIVGCFGLLAWYLRRQMRSPEFQNHLKYEARHQQHMERVEQVLERIATALEEKNKKNG